MKAFKENGKWWLFSEGGFTADCGGFKRIPKLKVGPFEEVPTFERVWVEKIGEDRGDIIIFTLFVDKLSLKEVTLEEHHFEGKATRFHYEQFSDLALPVLEEALKWDVLNKKWYVCAHPMLE